MRARNQKTGARLRLVLKPDFALGPGKIDLLQGIQDTGSIAAAGRRMGMSYRRAWLLIEELNRSFKTPLVAASKGGAAGGGAVLTATGKQVLQRYRRMEKLTAKAIGKEWAVLRRLAAPE